MINMISSKRIWIKWKFMRMVVIFQVNEVFIKTLSEFFYQWKIFHFRHWNWKMEVNQSAASSIAERITLPMKRHLVVNFSVTLGVQHTLIHETFLLLIQLFPLKSRRMSNPLHDVKVTWFNLMCPKHKILPNLYIYAKKGRWSARRKRLLDGR